MVWQFNDVWTNWNSVCMNLHWSLNCCRVRWNNILLKKGETYLLNICIKETQLRCSCIAVIYVNKSNSRVLFLTYLSNYNLPLCYSSDLQQQHGRRRQWAVSHLLRTHIPLVGLVRQLSCHANFVNLGMHWKIIHMYNVWICLDESVGFSLVVMHSWTEQECWCCRSPCLCSPHWELI